MKPHLDDPWHVHQQISRVEIDFFDPDFLSDGKTCSHARPDRNARRDSGIDGREFELGRYGYILDAY